jgi:hypothetical protein
MDASNYAEFSAYLRDVMSLYGKVTTDSQEAMFFKALDDRPIGAVKAAFIAHIKDPVRGRYPPLPADIIGRIIDAAALPAWMEGVR